MTYNAISIGVVADESTLTKSGNTISEKDNGTTGAKIAMGSDAQGDILYYDGTDYARLGAGTSGYFLKTQGAGANPIWAVTTGITPATEASSTPITDNAQTDTNGIRQYAMVTLPSTEKFYRITGIEWKNGTAVAGNVLCGVSRINANPPTLAPTTLLALGARKAMAGVSSLQRNSEITSAMIEGGATIGVWIENDEGAGTHKFRLKNDATSEIYAKTKAVALNEPTQEATAWDVASQLAWYIKVYYVGYS